ncbi:MAG: hypothetical protein M1541_12940 [Acidobacteria bacterium]|nr:hypothetical protein [Acidobacteriota bacterium]
MGAHVWLAASALDVWRSPTWNDEQNRQPLCVGELLALIADLAVAPHGHG